jgi:hypothetical protein
VKRLAATLLLLGALGCTSHRAEPPPEAGTATTTSELAAVGERVDSALATPAPTGGARAAVLRACIDLRRSAEWVASSRSGAARRLRERLGDSGRTALADAARDCTLDVAAARAAVARLRTAVR